MTQVERAGTAAVTAAALHPLLSDKDVAKRLETSADDMAAKLAEMKVPMNHH